MKRYIKYHKTNSPLRFLFRPLKFYYQKGIGIYISKKEPIIYLKEFGDDVKCIEIYDKTYQLIPFNSDDYFKLISNDYLKITYMDNTFCEFQLIPVKHGLCELVLLESGVIKEL